MASFNKIILAGNVTRDPQLSYLPNQTPVCEFGLAVNHRWTGPNGEKKEDTCFIDAVIFGKQAETFSQYVGKGKPVLVEGRLQYEQWEKDGQKRSKHKVNVQSFQFLGSREDQGAPPAMPANSRVPQAPPATAYDGLPTGSDIPF